MTRARLRDLGISIGKFSPGKFNAITDVPDVLVGYTTIVKDEPRIARTGVTVIVPRNGEIWNDNAFAGFHSLNGCGEMTGIHWIQESGLLSSPIAITCTHQVGTAHLALMKYGHKWDARQVGALPVVAETWDGWLNDAYAFHVTEEDVLKALETAASGVPEEGCVGGGTGMICYDFKGGTGTASRIVPTPDGTYTVGALVQANHGDRSLLRLQGAPVGKGIPASHTPEPWPAEPETSSIIVVVATDAPLLPMQCQRLAQRATIGLARTGGLGTNGSGDIFLAFATGNHVNGQGETLHDVKMMPGHHMNELIEGTAEAVEEAIWNVMTAAETTTGFMGRTAHAIPLEEVKRIWAEQQKAGG
jgi:D-aminopeptidase